MYCRFMNLVDEVSKIMKDAIAASPPALRASTGGAPIGSIEGDSLEVLGAQVHGHSKAILRLAREIEQL